jgi:hypothetical protein
MSDLKEYNNFLPDEEFKKLQNLIFHLDFPWRIRKSMTISDQNIYFTHSFFNKNTVNSEYYNEYIIPILTKLKCVSPIEIRANVFLSKLFEKSGWHTDCGWHTDYQFNNHFSNITAIFYLNNCNGGTELKIKDKIKFVKAEENKMLIFDSNTEHRVCTSTDIDKRYIINFNYF